MKKDLSSLVFNALAKRRRKYEEYLENVNLYLEQDEKYNNLQAQINKLNAVIGKLSFQGLPFNEQLNKKLELENQLEQRLTELKINKSDLTLKHYCNICNDQGYVNGKPCTCYLKLYNKLILKKLGISHKELASFEKDCLSDKAGLTPLYDKFKKYCECFSSDSKSYIFYGKCGTGKTFLAEAIANELKDKEVLYLNSFELNDFFIKYHSCDINEKSFYYSTLKNSDLIVIDDLGSEPIYNKVTVEYLFLLLTARKNKPFIITTNLSPKEILNKYGERIFARIFQNENTTCIEFDFENLRILK